jgi:hypothetical protein
MFLGQLWDEGDEKSWYSVLFSQPHHKERATLNTALRVKVKRSYLKVWVQSTFKKSLLQKGLQKIRK